MEAIVLSSTVGDKYMNIIMMALLAIGWMEAVVVCLLTLVLAAALAAFVNWWAKCREGRHPPGPKGLPIIGHLHMLGSLPHQTLAHLSERFGPLMSLRLGSRPLLVASSPDMAKLILHTHDKVFSARPQHLSIPRLAFNNLDIAFCSAGPYWKLMRQLCFAQLFSSKRLDCFLRNLEEEVERLLLSIRAAQGTPILIRDRLRETNSNVVAKMTLGTRSLQEAGAASSNGLSILLELFSMIGTVNLGDYLPWLAWLDLQGLCRRSKKATLAASSMLQAVIDTRRRRAAPPSAGGLHDDGPPPQDLLDALLMASLNSKLPMRVGDVHIRAVIMDMFFAGTDTSTVTTEWALAELLANPKKLMILKEELENVMGSARCVQESDLPNLPYLRAVVNETLRLHPPGPLLLPRMSNEACQISSYYIPKNTLVYVNVWAIQRDPKIWSNPLEFSPERFLNASIDELNRQCKFFPFGAGRRACPGWKLGLLSVQSILGSLIQVFDWKTLAKNPMNDQFSLASCLKDPLIVVPMLKSQNTLLESTT